MIHSVVKKPLPNTYSLFSIYSTININTMRIGPTPPKSQNTFARIYIGGHSVSTSIALRRGGRTVSRSQASQVQVQVQVQVRV